MSVKIVVLYPQPRDVAQFERDYEEHLTMAPAALRGATRATLSRALPAADGGAAPYHRMAEIHFASPEAMLATMSTPAAQALVAHAQQISTGGPLTVFVVEDQVVELEVSSSA